MTKYQRRILDALKSGEKIQYEIPGFFFRHRKLNDITMDALMSTGELARVMTRGKFVTQDFVIHRSCLREFVDDAIMIEFPFSRVIGDRIDLLDGA